jgi:threonyl-tRNA synthetase
MNFALCSPGSSFFLPNGAVIYNKLMDFMRQEYRKRGYQEVGINSILYSNYIIGSETTVFYFLFHL